MKMLQGTIKSAELACQSRRAVLLACARLDSDKNLLGIRVGVFACKLLKKARRRLMLQTRREETVQNFRIVVGAKKPVQILVS